MRGLEVQELLEIAVAEAQESTNGWYRATCPLCPVTKGSIDKKRSLGFQPSSAFFYCLRCGDRGFLRGDFHMMAARVADRKAEGEKPPEDLDPPEGFMFLSEEPAATAWVTEAAREYLLGRDVPPDTWQAARLGLTFDGWHSHRIIVPIISQATQQWVGWVGRVWEKLEDVLPYQYPKGMKRGQLLWNSDALFEESDDPVVVFEGVFDGLPHWPHAVACLGKPTRGQYPILLTTRRPIVVALDGDAWRLGMGLAMRLKFAGKRAAYIRLPPKTDPGNLKPGELIDMARRAL